MSRAWVTCGRLPVCEIARHADVRRRLALSAGSQTPCRHDSGTNLPGAERRSPHAV